MNRVFAIMLVVLFSSNVFAEVTEQDYLDSAKAYADKVFVSKFYWADGKYVYSLNNNNILSGILNGMIEARAGELCGKKGYIVLKEETIAKHRKQIIRCNE